jgi:putative tricarboxylic transport membrane protein
MPATKRRFRSADLWSGLVLAGLGAYIVATASRWEYSGADGPGPGFFPLWYGIAMLVISLGLVVSSARAERRTAPARVEWRGFGRALSVWLALAAAVAASKLVGLIASFALFTWFIVAVMYRRPATVAAGVAVAMAVAFYLLFPVALGVALPVGILGF